MRNIFFIVFVFIQLHTKAQEVFVVYSFKGDVTIVENKNEAKAKIGRILNSNAEIKVSNGAVISLICNEVNLVTLPGPGKFSLSNYKNACAANNESVTSNYLKYVWTQLTSKKGAPEKNRKAYMSNTGAVSRSVNNIWIDPKLDTFNYVSGNFPLSWKSYAEAEDFQFQLYEKLKSDKPVYTYDTKNKFVTLKQVEKIMKPGKTYYWTAVVKDQENEERKIINVYKQDDYMRVLESLNKAEGGYENEAEKAFRMAFLLEDEHFLYEAYMHYQKAVKNRPDVSIYKTTLEAFKKDYGLIDTDVK